MQTPFCVHVREMRLFGRFEHSEPTPVAIDSNRGCPLFPRFSDAEKPVLAIAMRPALILPVRRQRHVSQVAQPIVVSNAVDVVNLSVRPHPFCANPRNAMPKKCFSAKQDFAVSTGTQHSSFAADLHAIRSAHGPPHKP